MSAQGDMRFFGTTTKDKKPLAGATITVYIDGEKWKEITTGKNGKFKFLFDLGHEYRLNFNAPGCVNMFMILNLKVPADKSNIYPDYAIEIPFFDTNEKGLRLEKFRTQPFAKVIFDGRLGFHDDPNYSFSRDLFVDPNEENKKKQELLAMEKARKEAEEKNRRDEAERIRKLEQEREAELLVLKEKEARERERITRKKVEEEETMETEAMKLERERQERLAVQKKNKTIKTQYENDLLKMVAESEKKTNIEKYNKMKTEAQTNSVIQSMRKEAERKASSAFIRDSEREKKKQTLENKQVKSREIKKLVEAAAFAEKTVRVNQSSKPGHEKFSFTPRPNIVVANKEGTFSDRLETTISVGSKRVLYVKESHWYGSVDYYRNGKIITEKEYKDEIASYKAK